MENWGGVAEGKRAEESMSEQGLLQAEATDWRPKGWILLWACFIWPAHDFFFFLMELSVFTQRIHSFLHHHPYHSSFSSLACLNTFME